jgi:hypothetical protein
MDIHIFLPICFRQFLPVKTFPGPDADQIIRCFIIKYVDLDVKTTFWDTIIIKIIWICIEIIYHRKIGFL